MLIYSAGNLKHLQKAEQSASLASFGVAKTFLGKVMTTTITGIRLQDDIGDDFLVISVPWDCLATPEAAAETIMEFSDFDFPYILASCLPDSRWIYAGPGKLTAISESKLGQNPKWQEIPVSPPVESEARC